MGGRGSKGYTRGSLPQEPQPLTLASEFPTDAPPEDEHAPAQDRLRSAFGELLRRPDGHRTDYVSLTQLRAALPDVPDEEFDRALTDLACDPNVSLIPEVNQKTLTPEDRASAIFLGGENKHLLSIRDTALLDARDDYLRSVRDDMPPQESPETQAAADALADHQRRGSWQSTVRG